MKQNDSHTGAFSPTHTPFTYVIFRQIWEVSCISLYNIYFISCLFFLLHCIKYLLKMTSVKYFHMHLNFYNIIFQFSVKLWKFRYLQLVINSFIWFPCYFLLWLVYNLRVGRNLNRHVSTVYWKCGFRPEAWALPENVRNVESQPHLRPTESEPGFSEDPQVIRMHIILVVYYCITN